MVYVALSSIILMFLFHKLILGDHKFIGPDALSPAAIAQGIESAEVENEKYPLWLPWVFSGLPSTHSLQNISKYYIPHNIIHYFENFGIPRIWNYILHFIFGGFGCYLLLKRLKTDNYSAIFGGLAFMLTPYLMTMVVHGHGSQMMTSAYIPWVIWGIHRLMSTPNILNLGIFSLIIGLQLQRAHVQIAYYTWMLAGLYILILLIRKPKEVIGEKIKPLLFIFAGLLIGLGMAMSIYLPATEYTPYSIRGAGAGGGTGIEYATQWSFSFQEMSTFILPSALGFGSPTYWGGMPFTDYPNYMGILVIILAVFGAIKSKGNEVLLFIFGGIFAIILSFGKNFSIVYGLFYDYFPYFNKFRVPVMILILTQFSTAMLAGLGLFKLKNFVKEYITVKHIKIGIGCILVVGAGHLLFGSELIKSLFLPVGDHPKITEIRLNMLQNEVWFLIIILTFFMTLLYCWKKEIMNWSYAAAGIIAISVLDLSITDSRIIEPDPESFRSKTLHSSRLKRQYLRSDDVIKFLKLDTSEFRILPVGKLANENRWAAFHLESVMGYHPAKLHNYNELITKVGFQYPGILQMLNVKYLISFEPMNHPLFKEVFQGKLYFQGQYVSTFVYEYLSYLNRAYFIDKLTIIPEKNDQYAFLQQIDFNPVSESIIGAEIEKTEFGSDDRIISLQHISPDEIQLETNTKTDQFLVLSEIYYPNGWKAFIDDNETEIYEVNTVLRGIPIPPGNHRIIFIFTPDDIKLGSIISIISLCISVLSICAGKYFKI